MCRHFMEKLQETISQKPQENRQPLHSTTHKELKKHKGYIYMYVHLGVVFLCNIPKCTGKKRCTETATFSFGGPFQYGGSTNSEFKLEL